MFKKSSTAMQNQNPVDDIIALVQQMAALTPAVVQERCRSKEALAGLIREIEAVFEISRRIFACFKNNVGYPNDDATLNGINAYASGEMRKLAAKLFDQDIPEFTRMIEEADKLNGVTRTRKIFNEIPEKKQLREKRLAELEKLARQYLQINKIKPELETHLALLRIALDVEVAKSSQPSMPSKKM